VRVKRYEARIEDYGDLLARIKDEMGSDVLVQTRRFRKGGLLGLFGVQDWVEVLAARKPVEPRQAVADSIALSQSVKRVTRHSDESITRKTATGQAASRPIETNPPFPSVQTEGKSQRERLSSETHPEHTLESTRLQQFEGNGGLSVKQEIRELKKMVEDLTRTIGSSRAAKISVGTRMRETYGAELAWR